MTKHRKHLQKRDINPLAEKLAQLQARQDAMPEERQRQAQDLVEVLQSVSPANDASPRPMPGMDLPIPSPVGTPLEMVNENIQNVVALQLEIYRANMDFWLSLFRLSGRLRATF